MDDVYILLIAAPVIALGLLGHIGFFLTIGARRRLRALEQQFALATQRIGELELRARPATAAAQAEAVAEPTPEPAAAATWGEPEAPVVEEAAPTPSEPAAPIMSEPAAEAPPPGRSLEETLGARWTVWVGGVALALGAALMVRWSVENGWFGPAARISLGLGFSGLVLLAGERLRRSQGPLAPGSAAARANAPATLTGAGVVGLFASVYAAHALYGYLDATFAFVGLAPSVSRRCCSPRCMGRRWRGSACSARWRRRCWSRPLIPRPGRWCSLGVVGAANQAMARLRRWLWLALAAAAGGLGWTWLLFETALQTSSTPFYHAALAALTVHVALAAYFLGRRAASRRARGRERAGPVRTGRAGFACGGGTRAAQRRARLRRPRRGLDRRRRGAGRPSRGRGRVVAAGGFGGGAWRRRGAGGAVRLAGGGADASAGAAGRARAMALAGAGGHARLRHLRAAGRARRRRAGAGAAVGRAAALARSGRAAGRRSGADAARRPDDRRRAAVGRPRLGAEMAAVAAGLAALFVGAARLVQHRLLQGGPGYRLGLGALASGGVRRAGQLGLVFVLESAQLTLALSLTALATAWIAWRLELTALRWASAVVALVVAPASRGIPERRATALRQTPVLNWLLFGYGTPARRVPAGGAVMCGGVARTRRCAWRTRAGSSSALLVFFEIRHA